MDTVNQIQNLDKAVYIFTLCLYSRERDKYNYSLSLSSYGKIVKLKGFFNLCMATGSGERKLWIQTC